MKKKLIAFLIAMLMVIALVPTTVFAENEVMDADITVNSKPPAPPDTTEKFTVTHHGASGQGQGGYHGDIKVSYYEPGSSDPNPKLLSDDDEATYDYHAGWTLQIDFVADQGWKYWRHVENEGGPRDTNPRIITTNKCINYRIHPQWRSLDLYEVNFDSMGGSGVPKQNVPDGGKVTKPTDPTKTGSEFAGWYNGDTLWDFENNTVTKNITLCAKWTELNKVTFDSEGGTPVSPQFIADGGKVTKPTDPTKAGFAFDGWYYKQGFQKIDWDFSTNTVTDNITLYARWIEQHTVSFNSTGGSQVASQTVPDGGKATKPADPTRTGYVFDGWYYYKQGNQKIDWNFDNQVKGDIKLYARWIEQHTVTFDSKGGSSVDSQTVPDGGKVTKPTDPTKTGYVFDGWYYSHCGQQIDWNFSTNTVNEDITLCARWTELNKVTFDSEGGTPVSPQFIADGGKVTKPTDPTKAGFAFDGWYYKQGFQKIDWDFSTNTVTDNITLYARWIEQHTVTFDSKGGSSVDSQTVPDGGKVTKPANPSKEGYVFDCWLFKISKNTYQPWNFDQYPVKGDITLYARWIEVHTVAFDSQGGSPVDSQTVSHGGKVIKPANPTKTGYTFVGWYYNDCGKQKVWKFGFDKVDRNLTLIAKWTANGYIVKYNINGGDGGVTADSSHTYDIESNLTANGYYKAGHTFAGWATSAEGSSAEYGDGESVKNLTDADGATVHLYAVWAIKQFDVTFYKQDGTTVIDQQKVNWNAAAQMVDAPSITGFAFDKWILKGYDDTESTSLVHVKEKIDAVASYIKNGYTVTFLDYNGTVLGTDGVLYGEAAEAPEKTPAREGYTFTGWDKAFDNVTSNLTVTAQYAINTYTVKFVDFDGRELKSQKVNWNTAATAPASPAFTGYTFTGWDKSFDKVTSDLTVTAQYAINTYTVKFVDFDGKELSVQTVNWNSAAIAPASPIRTGYTFTNWDKAFDKVTSDLTVTAQYAINTYTVKFVDFDGRELSVQKVNWGAAAAAPASPTFTGFTFARWDKAFDKVTSDLTVTAQYAINKYTVKFVDFDGKELSVQTVNWNSAAIAPASPNRTGYTFTGWDKAFASITSDLTVTAQYKQNVSIDDEGVPKTYDDSQAFPWWWIVAAAALIGAIVWIIAAQARKHKSTGDAV